MSIWHKAATIAALSLLIVAAVLVILIGAAILGFLGVLCAATFVDHTPEHLVWLTVAVGMMTIVGGTLVPPVWRWVESVCEDS